jgi:hypothetical protein
VSDLSFGIGAIEVPSAAVNAAEQDPRGWVTPTVGSEVDGAVHGNRAVLVGGAVVAVVTPRRAGDPQVLEEVEAALEQASSPSPGRRDETVRLGGLVSCYEIGKDLGVRAQTVRKWTERPWLDFPPPRRRLGRRGVIRLYSRDEVLEWHRNRHRHKRRRGASTSASGP